MLGDVSEVEGGQMRGAEGDFQVVACAPGRTELDRGRSETGDGGGTNDGEMFRGSWTPSRELRGGPGWRQDLEWTGRPRRSVGGVGKSPARV